MKDEKFMRLALQLAEKGKGRTSPNPMVGAVVVKKDRILAKGYHQKFGGPHAEATALKTCGNQARGATLYTTLEPCCHFGKTPPCTDLIIQSGIKRVVCATIDPNPQVNGKGMRRLKKERIKVSLGILQKEARKLNEVYFKYITTKLPFIVLKVAQTLDGRIIRQTKSSEVKRVGIFSELIQSKKLWVDAILCDANTTETDYLKTFLKSDDSAKSKMIVAGNWREIRSKLKKFGKDSHKNVIVVPRNLETVERKKQKEFKIWKIKKRRDGEFDLVSLLKKAGDEGITSLLVEGGTQIAGTFLRQKLVDKIWYFISPNISGKGVEPFGDLGIRKMSDSIILKDGEYKQFKDGLLVVGYPADDRRGKFAVDSSQFSVSSGQLTVN
ncbi:MAG: bifunctional diaminohydroxyphosphoribosylaminopyrimidine deaminase/5-amino-6-(5-phosphoribosylamino)uracil reductase RibD [candidate division Zixibacteria bacterium]|nr:bifunctional diaminohydroxyphosphoribosylaminopyrimidine deaminase/5-amino-6-(5-phosphoribosylamino)uracil reductase RibD [candidate division Zixibacteria bacterium]